jgi:putative hydrolase of the HAD superfamily
VTIQAVVFDWGGTLSVWVDIDIEDMWRLAARHIAPEREEELTAVLVAVEARSWERNMTDQRSTRLAELLMDASREVGVDVASVVLEEAASHHLDSWTPHIRHHDDAPAVLSALREDGLAVGLLSNTHWPRAFHEHFLERDGLAASIDARLYTSEMEFMKPHPSVFAAALERLGIDDPSRAVYVGDRLYDDVWGAKQVGMRAVWVRNHHNDGFEVEPDGIITTLSDLPDLLGAWS